MIFNNKLLSLRDKKKNLVTEINADIDRLEQIQFILAQPLTKIINRVSLKKKNNHLICIYMYAHTKINAHIFCIHHPLAYSPHTHTK